MNFQFPRTNLEEQLLKTRDKNSSQQNILEQVNSIFESSDATEEQIVQQLQNGEVQASNSLKPELIDTEKIFHLDDIYKICVNYRLRFLSSKFFRGEIPYEALIKIKDIEKNHQTKLKGFKILAPSKLFKLENADDPLLFAPIGNDYYYLIHKWGNDLHPFRKILMWPFRNLENFVVLLLALSLLTALLIPKGLFSPQQTSTQFFMIFFFIFKWFAGLSIFYGFKKGKNFSTEIWNSKFYNA